MPRFGGILIDEEPKPRFGGVPVDISLVPKKQEPAGAWETTKLIGEQIADAAMYHIPGGVAAGLEGTDPFSERDWKDETIERSRRQSRAQVEQPGRKSALPGIDTSDISSLGHSLGFSAAGMAAGLAAGVPASFTPAGPIGGMAAGGAASGVAAYRMSANQFVRDLRESVDIDRKQKGLSPISDTEFSAKATELAPLIKEYGLWEAVPEAAANVAGFGILKAPVAGAVGRMFGKSVLTRTASKAAALFGGELATETVTGMGQHNVGVQAGAQPGRERDWTSTSDLAETFKEIAPSTVLQTALLGGGVKGGMILADRLTAPKPPDGFEEITEDEFKSGVGVRTAKNGRFYRKTEVQGDRVALEPVVSPEGQPVVESTTQADLFGGTIQQPEPLANQPLSIPPETMLGVPQPVAEIPLPARLESVLAGVATPQDVAWAQQNGLVLNLMSGPIASPRGNRVLKTPQPIVSEDIPDSGIGNVSDTVTYDDMTEQDSDIGTNAAVTEDGHSIPGEFVSLFDNQGRRLFPASQGVRAFREQHGLGNDGVTAIQSAIQRGEPITIEQAKQIEQERLAARKAEVEGQNSEDGRAEAARRNSEREAQEQAERDGYIAETGPIEPGLYEDVDLGVKYEVLPTGLVLIEGPDGMRPLGALNKGRADSGGVAFASYVRSGVVRRIDRNTPSGQESLPAAPVEQEVARAGGVVAPAQQPTNSPLAPESPVIAQEQAAIETTQDLGTPPPNLGTALGRFQAGQAKPADLAQLKREGLITKAADRLTAKGERKAGLAKVAAKAEAEEVESAVDPEMQAEIDEARAAIDAGLSVEEYRARQPKASRSSPTDYAVYLATETTSEGLSPDDAAAVDALLSDPAVKSAQASYRRKSSKANLDKLTQAVADVMAKKPGLYSRGVQARMAEKPTTVAKLKAAISKILGGRAFKEGFGGVVVVQSAKDLPATVTGAVLFSQKAKRLGGGPMMSRWINANEKNVDWNKVFAKQGVAAQQEELARQAQEILTKQMEDDTIKQAAKTNLGGYLANLVLNNANPANPQLADAVRRYRQDPEGAANRINEQRATDKARVLKAWRRYLTETNDVYAADPLFSGWVWRGIVKALDPKTDYLLPELDAAALAAVYERARQEDGLGDFLTAYEEEQARALEFFAQENIINVGGAPADGWIKVPATPLHSSDFAKNSSLVIALSRPNRWCTSLGMEKTYLPRGDFWTYLEGGVPKMAIRFDGSEVAEIQGPQNNGTIPAAYANKVTALVESGSIQLKSREKEALRAAVERANTLNKIKEGKTPADRARAAGVEFSVDGDGLLVLTSVPEAEIMEAIGQEHVSEITGAYVGGGDIELTGNWKNLKRVGINGVILREGASAPLLTTVGGDLTLSEGASAPAVTTVGGDLTLYEGASAPAVTTVGGYLTLREGASAPAVTTVGGGLSLYEGASAPAVTTVGGDLTLSGGASASAVTTVGGSLILREGASAPAVTTVGGGLYLYEGASAPAVTTVGGNLILSEGASAPAVTTVGGYLTLYEGASAPLLTTVGGYVQYPEDKYGTLQKASPVPKLLNQGVGFGIALAGTRLDPTSPDYFDVEKFREETKAKAKGQSILRSADMSGAQAFYDPATNAIYMIADAIESGEEAAVFLHEAMHKHGRRILGDQWNALTAEIETFSRDVGLEGQIYKAAQRRLVGAGEAKGPKRKEELMPYYVEEAVKAGVKPSASGGRVSRWLHRVFEAIRSAVYSLMGRKVPLTVQQIVDIAYSMAQAEATESGAIDETTEAQASKAPSTILVDGVRRSTTNSEGKPIHPTEEGVVNFWRWFGNSKVVDADGRPLVVYHGTHGNVVSFDPEMGGTSTGAPSGRRGFFFTPNQATAEYYARGNIDARMRAKYEGGPGPNVMPVYLRITSPLVHDFKNNVFRDESYNDLMDDAVSQGMDGVIFERTFDRGEHNRFDAFMRGRFAGEIIYAAFNPTQIKSAIGNSGAFSPDTGDIRYSKAPANGGETSLEETTREWFVRLFQNKLYWWKKEVEDKYAKQAGLGKISSEESFEEAHFRATSKVAEKIRQLNEKYFDPMLKMMKDKDLHAADLSELQKLLHAKERNDLIRERTGKPYFSGAQEDMFIQELLAELEDDPVFNDAGSGIKDADIAPRMDALKEKYGQRFDDLMKTAEMARAAAKEGLKTRYEAGLLSKTQYDAIEEMFEWYVPLKNPGEEAYPSSGGMSTSGKEFKSATGRSTEVEENVTAQLFSDLYGAIQRSQKNLDGQKVLSIVQKMPGVATVHTPNTLPFVKRYSPATEKVVRRRLDPSDKEMEEFFKVKKDGVQYYIQFENPMVQRAMLGVGSKEMGEATHLLTNTIGAMTRLMSMTNTIWNLDFLPGNLQADIEQVAINLEAEVSRKDSRTKGKAVTKDFLRMIVPSGRAAWRWMWEKRGPHIIKVDGKDVDVGKLALWAAEDGVMTTWTSRTSPEEVVEDMVARLSELDPKENKVRWALEKSKIAPLFRGIEALNSFSENSTRFAVYNAAIMNGLSRDEAANLAKNASVHFHRKGELGAIANSLYMFFTASVQGGANAFRALAPISGDPKKPQTWKLNERGMRMVYGIMALSTLMAFYNASASDEDDDGKLFYDKIEQHVKERNLIFMSRDGKNYRKIRMPYGYNVFHVFADGMVSAFRGAKQPGEVAADVFGAIFQSFVPLPRAQSDDLGMEIAKMFVPSVLTPVSELMSNETAFGSPIYKENFPFGTQKPDSALSMRDTTEAAKIVAQSINWVSGGSKHQSGLLDVSPDTLEYIAGYYTGGAGRFWARAGNALIGNAERPEDIPIVRLYFGTPNPFVNVRNYYDNRLAAQQAQAEAKVEKDPEFIKENRALIQAASIYRSADARIKNLNEQIRNLEQRDISSDEMAQKTEELELRIENERKRANKRFYDLTDSKSAPMEDEEEEEEEEDEDPFAPLTTTQIRANIQREVDMLQDSAPEAAALFASLPTNPPKQMLEALRLA